VNAFVRPGRWGALALVGSAFICALVIASSAKAAEVHEEHFCWGRTISPSHGCNQYEYELEGIHRWMVAVHVRGVEHSVCVQDFISKVKSCSGGPGQDAWITMSPTSNSVWPVITVNTGVQGDTTVYGWVHFQDPPPSSGGEGEATPPPPTETTSTAYRYMLGTSNGSGISSWSQLLGGMSKPRTMRVRDYTGDGKADIVASELQSNGLYRYMLGRSTGTGVSWNQIKYDMSRPMVSMLGDVTGDAKADIVSTELESSGATRYMLGTSNGTGVGGWTFLLTGKPEAYPMRVGDFTGDGKADIISMEAEGNGKYRYMLGTSNGSGIANYSQILSGMGEVEGMGGNNRPGPAVNITGLEVADFTGDGKADIVAAEREESGKVRYMLGTSTGTGVGSWRNMMGGMSPLTDLALADFTGDGKADVIAAEPEGNGKTRYVLGTSSGTGFASWRQLLGNMSPLVKLAVGDYNGDGKADIVAVERECGC
jgi:FG-GAP-like repeat